jgi:hypothetical protein
MRICRKHFVKSLALSPFAIKSLNAFDSDLKDDLPTWKFENLNTKINEAVIIQSVELLKTVHQVCLIVKANGAMGITQYNDRMPHLVSLL